MCTRTYNVHNTANFITHIHALIETTHGGSVIESEGCHWACILIE